MCKKSKKNGHKNMHTCTYHSHTLGLCAEWTEAVGCYWVGKLKETLIFQFFLFILSTIHCVQKSVLTMLYSESVCPKSKTHLQTFRQKY